MVEKENANVKLLSYENAIQEKSVIQDAISI